MASRNVKIYGGGKLAIPAAYRRELGIAEGDTVTVELVDGELRVRPAALALRRAQEKVRRFNRDGRSLVDELIADRRREIDCE